MSNTPINWENGKKYRRRNGVISKMTGYYSSSVLGCEAIIFEDGYPVQKANGKRSDPIESPEDIIEEVKENEMKIEVGKWYKSYYGGKVHIVHYNKDVPDPFFLDAFGNKHFEKEISEFLIEEWKEPKSGVHYINVYKESDSFAADSRDHADSVASNYHDDRIACVRVEWKEGQFDD